MSRIALNVNGQPYVANVPTFMPARMKAALA